MPIKQLTDTATESDLEARIRDTLSDVFSWLDSNSIVHQTKFSFTFGRTQMDIDGEKVSRHEARTDILVRFKDQPLAVLELKRPGHALTAGDIEQGLSYARMIYPSPPLVVVTNGSQTQLFETHSGSKWEPQEPSEKEVQKLFANAAMIAATDRRRAVEILLGPGSEVWATAVRAASRDAIAEMSGGIAESLRPFAHDFLIPREATSEAMKLLESSSLLIIEGEPLAGKSNVLREMAVRTEQSNSQAMLFIEAEPGGTGILQRLANILAGTLGWQVTKDEVRQWLRTLSVGQGPSLVLLLDGLGTDRDEIYRDVDELSGGMGIKLKIVLSVDDTVAELLVRSPNRRKESGIGRKAKSIHVGPLSDGEFGKAIALLDERHIAVMKGGDVADEYRSPWVLRAVTASAAPEDDEEPPPGAYRVVPSLLGTNIIGYARTSFKEDPDLRRLFQAIASAMLKDVVDEDRDIDMVLLSLLIFLVSRSSIEQFLAYEDIDWLQKHGVLRQFVDKTGKSMFVVRIPELAAAELASVLANQALTQIDKKENPAETLSRTSRLLPLGDIIVAQAILDATMRSGRLPLEVLEWFLNRPPTQKEVKAGSVGRMMHPEIGPVTLEVKPEGIVNIVSGNQHVSFTVDDGDFGTLTESENWLILSHIAGNAIELESGNGDVGRIDPELLLTIGASPVILRRVGSSGFSTHLVHSNPGHWEVVCDKAGIIEPILLSMYSFLSREDDSQTGWIKEAIDRKSYPLLNRLRVVLGLLQSSTNRKLADWATETSRDLVEPALSTLPDVECE